MAWSIVLVLVLVLFGIGFLWPPAWWVATGLFVVWAGYFLVRAILSKPAEGDRADPERPPRTGVE